MSQKDTTFTYYSANLSDLSKVGYESTPMTTYGQSRTPPSTVNPSASGVVGDRRQSMPAALGSDTRRGQRVDSRRRRPSRMETTEFGPEGVATKLRWSDEVQSIGEVVERFKTSLPVIARVRRGYSGHEDGHPAFLLAVDKVILINSCCEQGRIRAHDETRRELSLPYDCSITVRPNTPSGLGKPMRLSEAIEDSVLLPLTVRIVDVPPAEKPNDRNDESSRLSAERIEHQLKGTDLTITSVYNCRLLEAYEISRGWLDQQIMLLPTDLSAEVTVATGLIGATEDEWTDYRGMFARAVRQHRQELATGYSGIYYMDWSGVQPPTPPPSENGRLNVSPYIIAKNDNNGNTDAVRRERQKSRDPVMPAGGERRSASSSAIVHNRPLPPYRPPGGLSTSTSQSNIESLAIETGNKPRNAHNERLAMEVAFMSSHRGSVDCILSNKSNDPMTSSLSSTSSNSSAKSLPVSCLDVHCIKIDMCETELTSSDAATNQSRASPSNFGDQTAASVSIGSTAITSHRTSISKPLSKSYLPRMGKGMHTPALLSKNSSSTSGANEFPISDSVVNGNGTSTYGGSMPCLQQVDEKLMAPPLRQQLLASKFAARRDLAKQQPPQNQSRVRFSVDFSTVSSSGLHDDVVDPRSLETSGSSLFDEEGYYTKDSSISGSSISRTSSSSNGTTSSRRLEDIEPVYL